MLDSYSDFLKDYTEYVTELFIDNCGFKKPPKLTPAAFHPYQLNAFHDKTNRWTKELELYIPNEKAFNNYPPMKWVSRCIENAHHELCHATDPFLFFAKNNSIHAIFASMLDFVASTNPGFDTGRHFTKYDLTNYCHNINETRAEARAMNRTRDKLEMEFFSSIALLADEVMLDMVADKMRETGGHYCACIGLKTPPKTWEEFIIAAENSVKKAYRTPFKYDIKTYSSDPLANYMLNDIDFVTRQAALLEPDPLKQLFRLSILNNQLPHTHPEDTYFNMDQIDLSMSNYWSLAPFFSISVNEAEDKLSSRIKDKRRDEAISRLNFSIAEMDNGSPYTPDQYDHFGY